MDPLQSNCPCPREKKRKSEKFHAWNLSDFQHCYLQSKHLPEALAQRTCPHRTQFAALWVENLEWFGVRGTLGDLHAVLLGECV